MSLETAKKFMEDLNGNEKALEILKSANPDNEEEESRILGKAARETGYDVSDEDLENLLKNMKRRRVESSEKAAEETQRLSPEEIDSFAGGGDHAICSDTFKDDENCVFDDNCKHYTNMYSSSEDEGRYDCDSYTYCKNFLTKDDCSLGRVGF